MSNTITVRLPDDLAQWLASSAKSAGVSQAQIIRRQLRKALYQETRPFLRLAGKVPADPGLSARKGFAKQ
jgi:hypothetical protein